MHTADPQKSRQEQFLVNEEFVNTYTKVSDDGATSIPTSLPYFKLLQSCFFSFIAGAET